MRGLRQRVPVTYARALAPLLLVGLLAVLLLTPSGGAHSSKPNVVVIMTDDQRVADLAFMPKTREQLGKHGAIFDNSYVAYSLCCPSRATYLTGQYNHNNGVRLDAHQQRLTGGNGYIYLRGNQTLPVWMHAAGYYTGHIGKYLNGYGSRGLADKPPGWDEWFGSPAGLFAMYDYTLDCQAPAAPSPPDCGGTPNPIDPAKLRDYGHAASDYKTDVETKIATDFIARNTSDPAHPPFFLSVAPVSPHNNYGGRNERSGGKRESGTAVPPPRYAGHLTNLPLPQSPSFNEADVSDKPAYVRKYGRIGAGGIAGIRAHYHRRLESLLAVDDMVAKIVDSLQATGELDNTYIVFTDDNGYMLGEHRKPSGKMVPYEESIRVPLIIRGPGIPENVHRSQLAGNVDWAPTVAAMGGATPNAKVDGLSLLHTAKSDAPLSRPLLFEMFSPGSPYRGVRTGRWAYFHYMDGEVELYDLRRDPFELNNLAHGTASRQANGAVLRRLERLLGKLKDCKGASCRAPG